MMPMESFDQRRERGAWLVKTEKNSDLTLGVVDTTRDNMEVL